MTILTVAICLWASSTIFADDLADLRNYEYGGDQASLLAVEYIPAIDWKKNKRTTYD